VTLNRCALRERLSAYVATKGAAHLLRLERARGPASSASARACSASARACRAVSGRLSYDSDMKLGRNDPCHCGSGKKYKKCHEAADAAKESAELAALQAKAEAEKAAADAEAAEKDPKAAEAAKKAAARPLS